MKNISMLYECKTLNTLKPPFLQADLGLGEVSLGKLVFQKIQTNTSSIHYKPGTFIASPGYIADLILIYCNDHTQYTKLITVIIHTVHYSSLINIKRE